MKLPIIIIEGHDIQIFDSLSDAELELEVADVAANVYQVYDGEGASLGLDVITNNSKKDWWQFWIPEKIELVKIRDKTHKDLQVEELTGKLTKLCRDFSVKINDDANLEELISASQNFLRGNRCRPN